MSISDRVAACLQSITPPVQNMPVLVGVSGGADSLCLLHVLNGLAPSFGLELYVIHVEHGIRGKASLQDARFVTEYCQELGVPCHVVAVDAPQAARRPGVSLEEAARQLRYRAMARVAADVGANVIMLAHHADDQVETVVMHWLRGAGLGGLRGMLVESGLDAIGLNLADSIPIRIVRPLLDVWRAAIDAYCYEKGLEPRQDVTNQDTTYLRNRLRHELVPLLETYNPRFKQGVLNASKALAGDYDIVTDVVESAWEEACLSEDQMITLSAHQLARYPDAVIRALIRRAVLSLRRTLRDLGWIHADAALKVIRKSQTGDRCTLPGGLELAIYYDEVLIGQTGETYPQSRWPFYCGGQREIVCPGRFMLDDGWYLVGHIEPANQLLPDWQEGVSALSAYFDADVLGAISIRTRRDGDRMRPLGLGGTRKLKDIMIDAHVPEPFRAKLPILESAGEIVWVIGIRQSDKAKVTKDTQRVLIIDVMRTYTTKE